MNTARILDPQAAPRQALVISANQGHARMDRQCLKQAGITQVRLVASSKEALRHLTKHGADLVLVDDRLDDGSGWEFLRTLKTHVSFKNLPVIMASAKGNREDVLLAIKLGCVGFLIRPYTLESFLKYVDMAGQAGNPLRTQLDNVAQGLDLAEAGNTAEAMQVLNTVLNVQDEAQHHYERGMRQLAALRYDQAIESFNAATRISTLMAEAHLGLARCWLAKGDEVRYRKALTQAAETCARAARFERYKNEFLDILRADSREFNPFLALGMRLGRGRDWEGAAFALQNALWLSPNDPKCHVEMAKVHHFRRQPELATRSVSQALMLCEHDPESHALFERWTGRVWGEDAPDAEAPIRESGPTALPSMLNGVLYLAGMVTEGLHRFRRGLA